MFDDRIQQLIERLHTKTMEKSIKWEQSTEEDEYLVNFPRYSVGYHRDSRGTISLNIYNKDGKFIERTTEIEIRNSPFLFLQRKMEETYINARRQVLGVEQALDELLGELD